MITLFFVTSLKNFQTIFFLQRSQIFGGKVYSSVWPSVSVPLSKIQRQGFQMSSFHKRIDFFDLFGKPLWYFVSIFLVTLKLKLRKAPSMENTVNDPCFCRRFADEGVVDPNKHFVIFKQEWDGFLTFWNKKGHFALKNAIVWLADDNTLVVKKYSVSSFALQESVHKKSWEWDYYVIFCKFV